MNKHGYNQYKKNAHSTIFAIVIGSIIFVIAFLIFHTHFIEWVEAKTSELDYKAAGTGTVTAVVNPTMSMEQKLESLKDEVRNKIMSIEKGGITTEQGELFLTFDPPRSLYEKCRSIGGKMNLECISVGPLQFKIPTIIYYEELINGRIVTEKEALKIAHDIEEASRLFDDIVYNVEGGIWNWSAAHADPDYYSHVIPIIRKLME